MSIHNLDEKIKSSNRGYKDLFTSFLIVIIVSVVSFLLGRLSYEDIELKGYNQKIDIQNDPQITTILEKTELKEGEYFASKNGKIYYPTDCKSGNRIKSDNRVYFRDTKSAEFVGYKQSKSCTYNK